MQHSKTTEPLHASPLPAGDRLSRDLVLLQNELDSGGISAALKFLNRRVVYRFTAIYKFQGAMQHAVFIYDKLGQPTENFNSGLIVDGFCQYITVSEPFSMTDSATDARIVERNYRGQVAAFYGVSMSESNGKPTGSLCHFGFDVQVAPPPEECIFLNRARSLLLTRLPGFQR